MMGGVMSQSSAALSALNMYLALPSPLLAL